MSKIDMDDFNFQDGFDFAIKVVEALGVDIEHSKLVTCLKEVAANELDLLPSPLDSTGLESSEELRNLAHDFLSGNERHRRNEILRMQACYVLEQMGENQ